MRQSQGFLGPGGLTVLYVFPPLPLQETTSQSVTINHGEKQEGSAEAEELAKIKIVEEMEKKWREGERGG